jgi:Outer membrane protein beta-barrel domain
MRTMVGTVAVVAAVLLSAPAWAEVRVGVLGGANIARFAVDKEDPDVTFSSKTFLAAGAMVDVGFNDKLSLQLEPMYLEKGGKVELRNFFGDDFTASLRISYIELPVFLKVSKPTGTVRPYLIAGPSLGYRTEVKTKDEATGEEETTDDADETFEKWDFGVGAGGGLSFNVGRSTVFAEGRYTWGLTTVNKELDPEDSKLKNRGVQVLAGFTFPVGRR